FAGSVAWPTMAPALTVGSGMVSERTAAYRHSMKRRRRRGVEQLSSSPRPRMLATAFDRLLSDLQPAVHAERVPRVAQSEFWVHIAITPDVELNVRNVADTDTRAALE